MRWRRTAVASGIGWYRLSNTTCLSPSSSNLIISLCFSILTSIHHLYWIRAEIRDMFSELFRFTAFCHGSRLLKDKRGQRLCTLHSRMGAYYPLTRSNYAGEVSVELASVTFHFCTLQNKRAENVENLARPASGSEPFPAAKYSIMQMKSFFRSLANRVVNVECHGIKIYSKRRAEGRIGVRFPSSALVRACKDKPLAVYQLGPLSVRLDSQQLIRPCHICGCPLMIWNAGGWPQLP